MRQSPRELKPETISSLIFEFTSEKHVAFVEYQKKGNVAIISLNRPDRLNAIGQEITLGLKEASKRYLDDPDARAAILTGIGKAFSAGADINELSAPPTLEQAFNLIESISKPVIAAVNGYALGAGCLLMLACDIKIAARSAKFGMPEISRAIPVGPERFLAYNIPACFVMELLLTGAQFDSQRALEAGLINAVVPDEDLMPAAMKMAERIAEFSPSAVRLVKDGQIKSVALGQNVLDKEMERRLVARQSDEFKESVKAFIEKQGRPTMGTG
jgi:enoyl-CoA hydratase/carnithine racemase